MTCLLSGVFAGEAVAEQASASSTPGRVAAGRLDVGRLHSCAVLASGSVRCWGYGASGQLGYGNPETIGDFETPASAGPVSVGEGRGVTALAAGDFHSCALLDDLTVRCWGFGGDGRLGYGSIADVLDPGSAGPVNLGSDRTATAITAGAAHTCVILDDGNVRCWGNGERGALGYGNRNNVGASPSTTPDQAGLVTFGAGRTAIAITAGRDHTCALLDDGTVRCWGIGRSGQLGYPLVAFEDPGSTPSTTPDKLEPVKLGAGRTATAISAGAEHTCVVLDDRTVRCWGRGDNGRLGYGNTNSIATTAATTPETTGPVDLGSGRTAAAISAGAAHTCAVLDDGSVRCWGLAGNGRLGYPDLDSLGNQNNIGDNETPGSVGPVALGTGRTATAISAGTEHTCARLDDASVRCWGRGLFGRLGYCNEDSIGDDEAPASVAPVSLVPGDGGARCPGEDGPVAAPSGGGGPLAAPGGGPGAVAAPGGEPGPGSAASPGAVTQPVDLLAAARAAEARRAQALRRCRAAAARRPKRQRRAALRLCLKRHGRTPGRVTALRARAGSRAKVVLTFAAPGSDASRPPAARGYLVKQSRRPIRSARDVRRAQTLCKGTCRFAVTAVGAKLSFTITDLRPRSTYYYAVVARDNVSGRLGPRSSTARVRTR